MVILWISWWKNKSFWQRFTCTLKFQDLTFLQVIGKKLACKWFATFLIQVNLCQKLLFFHQLTHNMTTNCSLNYKFSKWKLQARTFCVHELFWMSKQKTICEHNMFLACNFMYWTRNTMNNLSTYCGLVDEKIRASD